MAYEMVMPYHLHMPSYFLETFTEYPQKELLEKEGITFKRNGCVNMSKHLWDITGSLTSTIGISPTSATWQ